MTNEHHGCGCRDKVDSRNDTKIDTPWAVVVMALVEARAVLRDPTSGLERSVGPMNAVQ
jgi:hypothetical protein